jgi:hypothetical protein
MTQQPPSPLVRLPIACACGQDAVITDPGDAPETADLFATPLKLSHGRPIAGRCLDCWSAAADTRRR